MPCIGIKCPNGQGNVKKLQCLNCKGCPDFPLPFRKAFFAPNFRHKPPQVSVSSLCGCPKQAYLKMTEDYYIDLKGIVAMSVGTGVHKLLEPVSAISEKFLEWITPKGNKCIGFFDSMTLDRDLYDLKTTTGLQFKKDEVGGKDAFQLQIYATILTNRYQVGLNKLKLLYLDLGKDKLMLEKEVPFKDMEEFMNKRIDMLQEAIDTKIVPKGEPMWLKWECNYCEFKEGCNEKVMLKEGK